MSELNYEYELIQSCKRPSHSNCLAYTIRLKYPKTTFFHIMDIKIAERALQLIQIAPLKNLEKSYQDDSLYNKLIMAYITKQLVNEFNITYEDIWSNQPFVNQIDYLLSINYNEQNN